MSYQVLARKLRPGTFDALVGQEHVVRALRHALDNDRLHHAYLFTGTRGVGKTTIARVLAKCLNCEQGVSSTPCGECSICREVAENRFVDLIEVDAASRTKVDDTRELLENAQYLPTRGRYKVYLIDEVHMLSASSFNALLKTLEEPPEHVKFLLATTDPKKVPVTVLSRCLQFQLKNISAERISTYVGQALDEEEIAFEPEALDAIAHAARGSMRDALSITDQAIAYGQGSVSARDVSEMLGLVGRDEVAGLLQAIETGDAAQVLNVTAELAERAVDFADVLAELISAFHRLAVAQALAGNQSDNVPSNGGGGVGDSPGDGPGSFTPEVVQLYYQIALMGLRDLQIAPDPRSGLEMTLLRMLAFAPDEVLAARVPRSAPDGAAEGTATSDLSVSVPAASVDPSAKPSADPSADLAAAPHVSVDEAAGASAAWHDIVAGLQIGGVARMIAEHSELLDSRDDLYRLRLDQAHDTLLSEAQVAAISRALTAHVGREVHVDVEVGQLSTETPAQRAERRRAELQRAAEETLATDDTVQTLIHEVGGRIDAVRPIEDSPG